jgi:hypothetical protein
VTIPHRVKKNLDFQTTPKIIAKNEDLFYIPRALNEIVYYVMRSKNEILCAAAGRLAAERSEADKPAKAHKTIFAPNNIYYFFIKPS